jgi:hypothetical protein
MTKVGKVMKSVAGTALRAAAAAATAVVMDKMTDVIAEKVQEMAEAGSTPAEPRKSTARNAVAKAAAPKSAKNPKETKARRKKKG